MGFLLKIVMFAVAVYGIWATREGACYRLFGRRRQRQAAARAGAGARRPRAAQPRRPVVEDTRLCAACGSYVSAGAAQMRPSGLP